jgi:N-acetylglutamate synthase-like GNAT family acetyltransferase
MKSKKMVKPTSLEAKISLSRKTIRVTQLPGEPAVYTLFDEAGNRIGYLVSTLRVTTKDRKIITTVAQIHQEYFAVILHVWIQKKSRRMGHGTSLVNALKKHADIIHAEPLTPAGGKLLKSCGFFKENDQTSLYRWDKQ